MRIQRLHGVAMPHPDYVSDLSACMGEAGMLLSENIITLSDFREVLPALVENATDEQVRHFGEALVVFRPKPGFHDPEVNDEDTAE